MVVVQVWIFGQPPLNNAHGQAFAEKPLSSNRVRHDLQQVLAAGGVMTGHTTHSARRGVLQHAAQEGASMEQLLEKYLLIPSICGF